jgi:uncharacterized protein DUF5676
MRIDPLAFGLSAGASAAALFTLCALGVVLDPGATTALFGLLTHTDLTGLARPLTPGTFLFGLVSWSVGIAVTFGFVAWLYNRLVTPPVEAFR